nr:small membrane A-kinase anchor protein isoform X1 [Pogona vitticeps]
MRCILRDIMGQRGCHMTQACFWRKFRVQFRAKQDTNVSFEICPYVRWLLSDIENHTERNCLMISLCTKLKPIRLSLVRKKMEEMVEKQGGRSCVEEEPRKKSVRMGKSLIWSTQNSASLIGI